MADLITLRKFEALSPFEIARLQEGFTAGRAIDLELAGPAVGLVEANKVLYAPGELGSAEALVHNFSTQTATFSVSLAARRWLQTDQPLAVLDEVRNP